MRKNKYAQHSAKNTDGEGAHEGFLCERFMVGENYVSAGASADIKPAEHHLLDVHEEAEDGISDKSAAKTDDAFDEKSK